MWRVRLTRPPYHQPFDVKRGQAMLDPLEARPHERAFRNDNRNLLDAI